MFLISYPNMRVQFQSAWALANIALLDEDCRLRIHDAGGTKVLFEWFDDMEFIAKLETLAAITNLTLSIPSIVTDDMVGRYKCIPFFISIITSNKMRYGPQFASIALANLASKEEFRELIRKYNGIAALVTCIMSREYQTRRYGCLALANMALSPSKDIEQAFTSSTLLDRIIKMAKRKEIETQREVIALLRNLSCHARIRPLLLDKEIMDIVRICRDTLYTDVSIWCEEIRSLMEREITMKHSNHTELKILIKRDDKSKIHGEADIELLERMEPLHGQVDWSTWGSKLETIFAPLYVTIPTVKSGRIEMKMNQMIKINLSEGIRKSLLRGWKDTMLFVIQQYPQHGKLNEKVTNLDYMIYAPHTNYIGYDSFTYILQIGSLKSWTAKISIYISPDEMISRNDSNSKTMNDLDELEAGMKGNENIETRISRSFSFSSSKRKSRSEVVENFSMPRSRRLSSEAVNPSNAPNAPNASAVSYKKGLNPMNSSNHTENDSESKEMHEIYSNRDSPAKYMNDNPLNPSTTSSATITTNNPSAERSIADKSNNRPASLSRGMMKSNSTSTGRPASNRNVGRTRERDKKDAFLRVVQANRSQSSKSIRDDL